MSLGPRDRALLAALEGGLPLVPRPYEEIGRRAGLSGEAVRARLARLLDDGTLKRFGIVVRHHELGYRANAMSVWDVPDAAVGEAGRRLAALPYVTLCYRRPRRLPDWPYNLFAMIHGRDRRAVEALVAEAAATAGLAAYPHALLFSRRRFKQCGASYATRETTLGEAG